MSSDPAEELSRALQEPDPQAEAVRAMAADPNWSLSRLADILDVTVDALSATELRDMTISFVIDGEVASTDVKPLNAIRSVASVLRARQALQDERNREG